MQERNVLCGICQRSHNPETLQHIISYFVGAFYRCGYSIYTLQVDSQHAGLHADEHSTMKSSCGVKYKWGME